MSSNRMSRKSRMMAVVAGVLTAAGLVAVGTGVGVQLAWSKSVARTGAVTGTVTFKGGAKGAGVVVSLIGVKAPPPGPEPAAQIKQVNKAFAPGLTVVPKGSVVEFPNQDKVFHNVFSVSRAARFDLGLYKSGTSKTVQLKRVGVVDVYCNIHPEMVAKVVVVDGPFWAVTGKDGSFTMAGVPPGTYPLVAYGGDGKEVRTEVTVTVGGTTTAKLEVAKPAAQPHLRKDGTPYGRYK